MHEFSVVANIIKTAEKTAANVGLKQVSSIKMSVGQLRQLDPDTLNFAFQAASKGTIVEGAKLEIENVPVLLACKKCGSQSEVEEAYFCPVCENVDVEIIQGKEIIMESINGI